MLASVECYSCWLNIACDIFFLIWLALSHCQGEIALRLVAWPLLERPIGSHLIWQQPGNCFQTLILNSAIICQRSCTLHASTHSEGFVLEGLRDNSTFFYSLSLGFLSDFFHRKKINKQIQNHVPAFSRVIRKSFPFSNFPVWLFDSFPNTPKQLKEQKREKGEEQQDRWLS